MPHKNKEERAEYHRQYRLDNKEKLKEYMKQYHLDNKEKLKEYDRQRYLDNKEKIKEKQAEYLKSPKGKKSSRIGMWKHLGLLYDTQNEIDEIYERYLTSKTCEKCDKEYTKKNVKCMDHCHNTGKFRNVLCNRCNCNTDRQMNNNNSSGVPNIYWSNTAKKWVYHKTINKKKHEKRFPYFIQAVIYKREYEASLL